MILNSYDLHWCVRGLPKALSAILKDNPRKLCIAGGYIRSRIAREDVMDIDVFCPSKLEATGAAEVLKTEHGVFQTDNAITVNGYQYPIQVIHRWTFESPELVVPSFDFTIAKAAFWWDATHGWQSLCDDAFYQDLSAKRLVYTSPDRNEDAAGSFLRLLKFYQRGYRAPLRTVAEVVSRMTDAINYEKINQINFSSPADRRQYVAKIITGLLREVDPNIDPDHIVHDGDTQPKEEPAQ